MNEELESLKEKYKKLKDKNTQLIFDLAVMEAALAVYDGENVSDFMESFSLVDKAREHMYFFNIYKEFYLKNKEEKNE